MLTVVERFVSESSEAWSSTLFSLRTCRFISSRSKTWNLISTRLKGTIQHDTTQHNSALLRTCNKRASMQKSCTGTSSKIILSKKEKKTQRIHTYQNWKTKPSNKTYGVHWYHSYCNYLTLAFCNIISQLDNWSSNNVRVTLTCLLRLKNITKLIHLASLLNVIFVTISYYFSVNIIAERAAELKISKYSGLDDKCTCLPANCSGVAWSTQWDSLLVFEGSREKDLHPVRWRERERESAFLFQRLSIVIQRFNAILLHDSFEAADHLC